LIRICTKVKGKKKILFFIRIRKGSIFEQCDCDIKATNTVVIFVIKALLLYGGNLAFTYLIGENNYQDNLSDFILITKVTRYYKHKIMIQMVDLSKLEFRNK
jgi:hypothetical protein